MTEGYSIGLALLDFVPNIAFLIGAIFLVRTAVIASGRPCSRLIMAGALLIGMGGLLKATWKLIYASGGPDIQWMSEIQFILVAPGFLGLLIAVILIARRNRIGKAGHLMLIAPWKLPFLFIMTLTSLGAQGILVYISFRRGAKLAAACFAVAFSGLLAMGMLASAEQTVAMQWIEESINSVGQLAFMIGSVLLYKNFKTFGCDDPSTG